MRLTLLSDTHGLHHYLPPLPEADILIHAGDVSNRGLAHEVHDFLQWFAAQPHPHKIFIAGNHDFFFEQSSAETIAAAIPPGIHYLCDSGVTIEGIHFWGTPVTPRFFDWAFNCDRGPDIARHYALMPEKVDVLITHGPPHGILDEVQRGGRVGCEDLLEAVKRIKPKLHVFGHIHEGAGILEEDCTTFINASVVDVKYRLVHPPRTVTLEAGALAM